MNKYFIILCILVLVGIGTIYAMKSEYVIEQIPEKVKEMAKITPTPVPFAELTISYLRNRQYTGVLDDRTLYQTRATYNSYLTSYSSDGLKINGLLTIPTTEEPLGGYPAIVFIHGYIPPTQYRTTEKYDDYVNYLARNGYVVFKIDLRGHGESEGTAGGAYYSSDYVIDALNAYQSLRKAEFVNAQRIGLWGHSMAGNVVMRSLAARPDIPAAVIWAGAVYTYEDLAAYRINDTSYIRRPTTDPTPQARQRLRDQLGEPSLQSELWKQIAPVTYLSDLKGAVQIHHAVNDDVVSIEYSRNLEQIAEKQNADITLIEHASGGHNITGPAFVDAMQETVEFFDKHL